MHTILQSRAAVVLSALVLVLAGGAATAVGMRAASDGVVHSCVTKRTGEPRIVDSGGRCGKGERALSWNQKGPRGPRGVQGVPGVIGSIDELDGTPCRGGTGTLHVGWKLGGVLDVTCVDGSTLTVTKSSSLPAVTSDLDSFSCPVGQTTCTQPGLAIGDVVVLTAQLPGDWSFVKSWSSDSVHPQWTGCDSVSDDRLTCTAVAPADVQVSFDDYRTWYLTKAHDRMGWLEPQVEACAAQLGTLVGCNAGTNGISYLPLSSAQLFDYVTTVNGVITGSTGANTYIRTPTLDAVDGSVSWTTSGSCQQIELC